MEWSYYTPKSRHYRVAEFFGVSYLLRGFGGTFLNFLTQSLDLRYKRLALLPVCSPSLNFVVRYEFWFAVSLVLRIARGLSAHPMGWLSVWPARVLTVLTTGTTRACPSSCSAYCWVALSKSVSFSKARLFVPQSKCCIMEECLRNVCVQDTWTVPRVMLSALLQFRSYRQCCGYHSDAHHVLVFSHPMRMSLGVPGVLPRTVACLITEPQVSATSAFQFPRHTLSIHGFPLQKTLYSRVGLLHRSCMSPLKGLWWSHKRWHFVRVPHRKIELHPSSVLESRYRVLNLGKYAYAILWMPPCGHRILFHPGDRRNQAVWWLNPIWTNMKWRFRPKMWRDGVLRTL